MNLDAMLGDYLAVRRALGVKLAREEKLIRQFLAWLAEHDMTAVTADAALAWAREPGQVSAGWLGMRMRAVRGFAGFCRSLDGSTEVPPRDVLAGSGQRATPYLYSQDDIDALAAAAGMLRGEVRQATYRALIRLLAVTGMRIGEAASLDAGDFDPAAGVLTVRDAKYGRTRLLPLHPTTVAALLGYRREIAEALPARATPALLVSGAGTRLLTVNIGATFRQLVTAAGLMPRSANCRPRPHDLRHAFAVRTLIGWFEDGEPVDARLPLLSAYLGHASPAHTYWYLDAAPELMTLAAARLHNHEHRHEREQRDAS
jgi:integrase/recombinase XerD